MNPFLRIEKPCEESQENMHDVPEGKFCDLCSKKVIDFSVLNDSEISKIVLENKGEKLCGIFFKKQLNRPLIEEKAFHFEQSRRKSFAKVAAGIALTASIVGSYPAQTTNIVQKELVNSVNSQKQTVQGKIKTDDGNFIISGRVISGDKQQPLSAEISFITVLKVYTAKTDENGYYSLEIPKDILKYESLLKFKPSYYAYDTKLAIYTIENLGKKQVINLDYNGSDKMYGEVSINSSPATDKSLVIMDGKKLDYKLFNKSFSMYYNRYELHYIPKEFVKFFTTKETINDIYIVFVKPK
ncbi:hypothetical protein NZ698_14330 [Chryseobacterium sp. PBS4-4]|uniref:Carboxypeptidase regulatory-like domain-containing protein n=1 Tax=Chryseobacterium edaphi TaxID=2976532 RepID=A0ABT2W8R8_9FLAO|nr:hypothetical protein [Chryseobacterium edaphi]MCU7618374.1 hypothetical protein [Chryseobacterium edaphi]